MPKVTIKMKKAEKKTVCEEVCKKAEEQKKSAFKLKVVKCPCMQMKSGQNAPCERPEGIPACPVVCKPKKRRSKCPKFRFIPFSEMEAKRKKRGKTKKTVCLRMMKNGKNSRGQSCQISTRAQMNEANLEQLMERCRGYGDHRDDD